MQKSYNSAVPNLPVQSLAGPTAGIAAVSADHVLTVAASLLVQKVALQRNGV